MTRLLTLTFLVLLPLTAWGEGYICQTNEATGFAYKNGVWKQARLKPDRKFVVRPRTERDTTDAKWVVEAPGVIAVCPDDFKPSGELACHGAVEEFRMNKNSLRFLHAYLLGYWDATPSKGNGGDTPAINIGKCSPM